MPAEAMMILVVATLLLWLLVFASDAGLKEERDAYF